MHECASVCVFIMVCLAKGFTIKPYLSRNLKLSVPSKNIRLNQCSHFSPCRCTEGRVGPGPHSRNQKASEGPPWRDTSALSEYSIYEYRPQIGNVYSQPDENMLFGCSSHSARGFILYTGQLICILTWKTLHPPGGPCFSLHVSSMQRFYADKARVLLSWMSHCPKSKTNRFRHPS